MFAGIKYLAKVENNDCDKATLTRLAEIASHPYKAMRAKTTRNKE